MSTTSASNTNPFDPIGDAPMFTCTELGKKTKLHPTTVRKMFLNEPGVLRLGHAGNGGRGKNRRRQYFSLRIPAVVAARVFARLSVGNEESAV